MGLKEIACGERPRVLLLGNGINRSFGTESWNELIDILSCGTYSEKEIKMINNLPYPMQVIIQSADCVDYGVDMFSKRMCETKLSSEQRDILLKIIDKKYDAILTTNYTYEVEKSLDDSFVCKHKQKCTYRKTTEKGTKADEQFGLFKYHEMNWNGQNLPVWHIHGEAARPQSIVIGHYYYGKLLSRMQSYVSTVIKRYTGCNKYQNPFAPKSWLDYFLIGDVDIIGLGLDTSEMDLWWLINCKKLNNDKLGGGTITWYEPNLNKKRNFAKKILADTYGMECVTEKIEKEGFKEYYISLAE